MLKSEAAANSSPAQFFQIHDLHAWYGESHILHGVELNIVEGECITVLGRNGAGKTTMMKAIMGLVPRREGSILYRGAELVRARPDRIAKSGIGFCPEERAIFASLDVQENLHLPPVVSDGGFTLEEIYALFPNIYERRKSLGTKLSGGEQQMLAIARILRTGSKLLLLDEPTEGLAPVIVQQIGRTLKKIKECGFTILLVEQNFHFASTVADRHFVMESGKIIDQMSNSEVGANMAKLHDYLGV